LNIPANSIPGDERRNLRYAEALREAAWLYQETQQARWWQRLARWATHQSWRLRDLAVVERSGQVIRRRYGGIQQVPLPQVQGSEGRTHEFDADFHPLGAHTRRRWLQVAAAWLAGEPLPPVELIRVDAVYYVRDGHHRISVLRALGVTHIEAAVTIWDVAPAPPVAPACSACVGAA
jgi:hypothetical protein